MTEKENTEQARIEENLRQGFADLDAQRTVRLKSLFVMKQSKVEMQKRNFELLKLKYGENHPLVEETSRKIELGKVFTDEIKLEIIRAETPLPESDGKTWLVHGYVLDAARNPVSGATVMFFDDKGNPLHGSPRAKTGKNGYFVLETASITDFPPNTRVGVSNEDLSEAGFTPQIGSIDYVEIFTSGKVEPPPPAEPPPPPVITVSDWAVTGKIVNARGIGIGNLTVRVYDKDLVFDDFLGETKTGSNGVYTLRFTKDQFSDFGENYPEIYLVIENEAGERLYDGKNEANAKSGHIELLDVQIDNA